MSVSPLDRFRLITESAKNCNKVRLDDSTQQQGSTTLVLNAEKIKRTARLHGENET